eukprot:6007803-Heterocapsa_arctica.AAC.1
MVNELPPADEENDGADQSQSASPEQAASPLTTPPTKKQKLAAGLANEGEPALPSEQMAGAERVVRSLSFEGEAAAPAVSSLRNAAPPA